MNIELAELTQHLQGCWQLQDDEQKLEISGTNVTILSQPEPVKTSFELTKNMQIGNWQIKSPKQMSWARTFIVQITDDTFTLYDFDLKVNIAMAQRTKLLNPTRIFKYNKVVS